MRMAAKIPKSRVLLVEDHPIARKGLAELLNSQPDLTVCGYAESLPEAQAQVAKCNPDVVILDITLKGTNGVEVLKHLKTSYPALKVLMLSMHDEKLYALRAVKSGALGYIMKQARTDSILKAIRQVLAGEIYLSDEIARSAISRLSGRGQLKTTPLEALSDRELEVFNLIGSGKSTRQIAEQLNLSVKTVETHRQHIKEKLNLSSGTELVQHAIQWSGLE